MSANKTTVDQISNCMRTPQAVQYLSLIWLAGWMTIPAMLDKSDDLNGLILVTIFTGCLVFGWSNAELASKKAKPYTFIVTLLVSSIVCYYLYTLLNVLFFLA